MPKTALHFGAGNIGRGFITPILQENGYEVVLVDVDSDLVNKLNTDQEYSLNFIGSSKESITVSNIDALNLSCLLYTSPSPRDTSSSRMPSSA